MAILITGGCGFIGSHFIRLLLQDASSDVVVHNVDSLSYAGHLETTVDFAQDSRYRFHQVDITDREALRDVFATNQIDTVVHFAAESHVDRSILDGRPFLVTNILGTQNLLDVSREFGVSRFVHISTDEVYGELGATGAFSEGTPLAPNSPYSVSKAASDMLVLSYVHTYGFPAVICRCSNNYGPYQLPEKLIPLVITRAMSDQTLPVYGKGAQIRDWIYVTDHCRGVQLVMHRGELGQVYNLGGDSERSNLEVVIAILSQLGKPESLIRYVADRLGHDFRYAMDHSKVTRELGWVPSVTFEQGLVLTVAWYRDNPMWIESVT